MGESKIKQIMSLSGIDFLTKTGRSGTPETAKGPLVGFLEAIGKLQKKFYAKNERMDCPIRVFLIIKKGGSAVGLKALKTIRSWGLDVDEAFILSGLSATEPLKEFLELLGGVQRKFFAKNERLKCPIRTYLIMIGSPSSNGATALQKIRKWGLEIDEALFHVGSMKKSLLKKIRPHILFNV